MHGLKIISILVLAAGVLTIVAAMLLLWLTPPPYKIGSLLIVMGLIFIVGSIILICVSQQYDMNHPATNYRNSLQ